MFRRFSQQFLCNGLRSQTLRRGIAIGGIVSSSTMLCLPFLSPVHAVSEEIYRKHSSYTNLRNLWEDFFVGGWNEAFGHRSRHSSVISPSRNSGIARIDSSCMASRERDQINIDVFAPRLPTLEWTLFGIFNGHSGSSTSEFLYGNLITAVTGFLADLYSSYNRASPEYPEPAPSGHTQYSYEAAARTYPPSDERDHAIKQAFQRVDNDIVHESVEIVFRKNSKEAAVDLLSPAMSGSGAILGFFDGHEKLLKIAVAGGAGAVLGRRVESSGDSFDDVKFEAQVITASQPTFKHPVTGKQGFFRSFGDGMFKWSQNVRRRLHESFLGDIPLPESSYPEVTAEPLINTVQIHPGDFVVMANSGVWDCLSSDEVVGLIAVWLKRNHVKEEPHAEVIKASDETRITYKVYSSSSPDSKVVWNPEELPVVRSTSTLSSPASKGDKELSWAPRGKNRRFINVDSNAASHIIHNAIGGANTDLVRALENMDPVRAEQLRDDLGVQVIFFK